MTVSIDDRIAQIAAEMRSEVLARFEPRALRWLALLPQWTDRLAEAVGFPAPDGIHAFIDAAEESNLCASLPEYDSTGTEVLRFWMRSVERLEYLEGADRLELMDDAQTLATALRDARDRGFDLAPGIHRWFALVLSVGEGTPDAGLTQVVGEAVEEGQVGDALEWIYAGEALTPVVGGEMASAVARAKRTVNLRYRAIQDARYLERFLARDEQIAVLDALLEEDAECWAVHFAGMGGVGKTMLMRYVTGPYASERDRGELPASRVDFDHLDPRYPTQRPARLLEDLAEGLTAYVREDIQESLLRSFLAAVGPADRAAAEATGGSLAALNTPDFKRALRSFAAFVSSLPQPVLLVLDTCEELAKLHPAGRSVPSVEATFTIIERLHAQAPGARVLFAGRRLLSPDVANWSRPEDIPQPPSIMSLAPRPYMVLHEVRGFRRQEAWDYFEQVRDLRPERALFDRILKNARDTGRVPAIESLGAGTDDEERYNPFDLALYANWLKEAPGLSAADLERQDVDPYVELRILDRLSAEPEVQALIPAAALLGTFDAQLMAPLLGADGDAARRRLLVLAEQEWIGIRGGADVGDMLFEVEPALRPRLMHYYSHDKRKIQLDEAVKRLRPALEDSLESPEVSDIGAHAVGAALDLLPEEDAAMRFDELARRVGEQGAWLWAEGVCGLLLAEDRDPCLKPELRASVRALYIATIRHRDRRFDAGALWQVVAEEAGAHPDPTERTRLSIRASLGGVVARTLRPERLDRDDLRPIHVAFERAQAALGSDGDTEVVAAAVAAVEAVVERLESAPTRPFDAYGYADAHLPGDTFDALIELVTGADEVDADLEAYAHSLRARNLGLRGDAPAAARSFARAFALARSAPGSDDFADWIAPASLRARIVLERERYALAFGLPPGPPRDAPWTAADVDSERLLSLQLRTLLAQAPVPEGTVEDFHKVAVESTPHVAVAPAHACVPPLFVSVAYAWLAWGRPERALELLAEEERAAAAGGPEMTEIAREAAVATACVLTRLRSEERTGLMADLAASDEPGASAVGYAGAALAAGKRPDPGSTLGTRIHSTFRAETLLEAKGSERHLRWVDEEFEASTVSSADRLHRALDRLEAALVLERIGSPDAEVSEALSRARDARDDCDAARLQSPCDPSDPLWREILRLHWRSIALDVPSHQPLSLESRKRVAAEMALEEGELLGLRVPEACAGILEEAETLFAKASDHFGAFAAALLRAIAAVHAGNPEAARAARDAIEQRAERAFPSGIDSEQWGGWQARLAAYRAWFDGGAKSTSLEEVPAELHLEPARGARSAARSRRARRLEIWMSVSMPRMLAAIIAVTAAGLGTGLIDDLWVRAGAVFVIFVLLYWVMRLTIPRLIATTARRIAVDVHITRPRDSEGRLVSWVYVEPGGRSRLTRLMLALIRRRLKHTYGDIDIEAESFTEQLPSDLVDSLPSSGLFGARPAIRLFVDSRAAEIPWEARLLAPFAREPGWSPKRSPRIWRVRRGELEASQAPPGAGALAVCGSEWTYFTARALSSVGGELTYWNPATARYPVSSRTITVVVGSPELTGAGWRMRLDNVDIPTEPGSSSASTSYSARTRMLVSTDELVRVGTTKLLVILGAPAGESLVADPEAAEGMRSFANAAHAAGVPTIVTVPTLPPKLAEQVLDRLMADAPTPRTRKGVRRTVHASDVVTELREIVFCAEDDLVDENARRESARVALDICLYGPP